MIELRDVRKSYHLGSSELVALADVDLSVARGESVALTGPSGSGKSTLMNVLGCLDTPSAGSYRLDGREVADLSETQLAQLRNHKIGFVFQNFFLMPRLNALDNVAQPLVYRGTPLAERRRRAARALHRVGLENWQRHKPNELSGGQRQRVAIARGLVTQPELLLADEPTGNLDSRTAADIMDLLLQLQQEGTTLIIVTHDPTVASYCKRIVRLHDGRIVVA